MYVLQRLPLLHTFNWLINIYILAQKSTQQNTSKCCSFSWLEQVELTTCLAKWIKIGFWLYFSVCHQTQEWLNLIQTTILIDPWTSLILYWKQSQLIQVQYQTMLHSTRLMWRTSHNWSTDFTRVFESVCGYILFWCQFWRLFFLSDRKFKC